MPLFFKSLFLRVKNQFLKEKVWLGIFGLSALITGQIRYIAHSEFWSIFYSKYLFQPGNFQDSLYSKFLFNASLAWIHWLPLGNIAHLVVARLVYSIVACGILYFTYKILCLKLNWKWAVFVLSFLYFNPITFWDLPQAKADILCLLVLLIALYFGLIQQKKKSLIFFALAFLTTPKSALFIPVCLAILFIADKNVLSWTSKVRLNLTRAFVVLCAVFFFRPSLATTYTMALDYFKTIFMDGLKKGFYFQGNTYFIELFLIYVFPSLIIVFLNNFFLLKTKLFAIKQRWLFFTVLSWCFVCVTIYPLKHPYFLIPILFFLVILSISNISPNFLIALKNPANFKNRSTIIFLIFLFPFIGVVHSGLFNLAFDQIRLISKLDDWLPSEKEIRIADGTGILPRARNVPEFIEFFDDVATSYFVKSIFNEPPEIIFMTAKVFAKYGAISSLIQEKYVYVSQFIIVKKIELNSEEIYSGEKIVGRLKQIFHFVPKIISFRAHSRIDKNRPIEATCISTQITKFDWSNEDLSACDKLSYNHIDWDKNKNLPEVYPVPFPATNEKFFLRLPELTNFKDFSLLDKLIMDFQSQMHTDYMKNK